MPRAVKLLLGGRIESNMGAERSEYRESCMPGTESPKVFSFR
jgi:hypothetical protein